MKKRGSSLVSVLLASSLCVLLAFTVAGVSISHLGVANRLENAQVARLNAEAVSHQIIALLCENPKLGTPQGPATRSLSFEISVNGGVGRATFDANAFDMPPCLNNINSNRAVTGWRRTLPPQSVQIISRGIFRNEVRTLESILVIPPYKYALATTGDFRSDGGLRVLGVESLDDLSHGLNDIPKDKVKPGHLASNSGKVDPTDPAMDLRADSARPIHITGDAVAVGSLRCDTDFVTIEGAPRSGSEPSVIPKLEIDNYDPALMRTGYQNLSNGRFDSSMNVTSAVRLQGNLNVQGGLNLDDGYVFVDGNVDIEGGIHGKGMVVSTGNVSVHGRAILSSSDSVGLAAKGDIHLIGQAANQSQMESNSFRGVIYTEGDFEARNLQVVGTVLGNKSGERGSQMTLNNVNLIHHPGTIDVDWSNGWEPDIDYPTDYWRAPADFTPPVSPTRGYDRDDYEIERITFNHHSNVLGDLALTPEQMTALHAEGRLPQGVLDTFSGVPTRKVFFHEPSWIQTREFLAAGFDRPQDDGHGENQLGLPFAVGLSDSPLLSETPWFRLAKSQIDRELAVENPDDEGLFRLDGTNSLWWTERWTGNKQGTENPLNARGPLQFAFTLHARSGKRFNSPCDYVTFVHNTIGTPAVTNSTIPRWGSDRTHDVQFEQLIAAALARVGEYDSIYAASLDRLRGGSILDGSVSLDPNQFIQLQDKMKRVLVREVTP